MDNAGPNTLGNPQRKNSHAEYLTCNMYPYHVPALGEPHDQCAEGEKQDHGKTHEDAMCSIDVILQMLECWRRCSLAKSSAEGRAECGEHILASEGASRDREPAL